MDFLKDFFPSSKPEHPGQPLSADEFYIRVKQNNLRNLEARQEILSKELQERPPLHSARLLNTLKKLSQFAVQLAMLDWRIGNDPRPYLLKMKDGFDAALGARPEILSGTNNSGFLAIISFLMDWDLPFTCSLPTEEDFDDPMIWMERWIVAGLFDESCWPAKETAPPVKNRFIETCLDDYWLLLTEQIDSGEGVNRCIKNYDRRATHQTFKNLPPLDAGGKYNEIFVDYALAAIMKKRGVVSGTVHDWVWS